MLILTENSYVEMELCELYINTHYVSSDKRRLKWAEFSEEDKEIFLICAKEMIDSLDFAGIKSYNGQSAAFPRTKRGCWSEKLPKEVLYAQIEMALWLANKDTSMRAELRAAGVTGIKFAEISENYRLDKEVYIPENVLNLLGAWLHGGREMI